MSENEKTEIKYDIKKEINQLIGKGAFSSVYKGKASKYRNGKLANDNEIIALKEIPINLDQETLASISNEIIISTKLKNDNIVRMIEWVDIQGKSYIAYEYCNGGDLRKYMDYFKTFDEGLIQTIMSQIVNGLSELFQKDVVHHDIKPENILLKLFYNEDNLSPESMKKYQKIKDILKYKEERPNIEENFFNNNNAQIQQVNNYQTNINNINNNIYPNNPNNINNQGNMNNNNNMNNFMNNNSMYNNMNWNTNINMNMNNNTFNNNNNYLMNANNNNCQNQLYQKNYYSANNFNNPAINYNNNLINQNNFCMNNNNYNNNMNNNTNYMNNNNFMNNNNINNINNMNNNMNINIDNNMNINDNMNINNWNNNINNNNFNNINNNNNYMNAISSANNNNEKNFYFKEGDFINILKDSTEYKLSDFGLSKLKNEIKKRNLCGSPLYMSPELFKTDSNLTDIENRKLDIWALGVLAYELFFGKRPFEAFSLEELSQMYERGLYQIDLSCTKEKKISKEFFLFLNKCLQKDPEKRANVLELKKSDFLNLNVDFLDKMNQTEFKAYLKGTVRTKNNQDGTIFYISINKNYAEEIKKEKNDK